MTTPRRPSSSLALDPEILLSHSAWLARLARALVARDDEVDDVVQQTYAQALARPPGHAGNLRGWLGTIARNVVRMNARSQSARVAREIAVPAPTPVETPVEAVERAELRRKVVEAVLALDEPYRSTVILRFFEEQEIGTIARLTSAGEDTVRTRLRRGVLRLREQLERKVAEEARGAADEGAAARALLYLHLREIAAGGGGGGATGSAAAARGLSREGLRLVRDATVRRVAAAALVVAAATFGWWSTRDPRPAVPGALPAEHASKPPRAESPAAAVAADRSVDPIAPVASTPPPAAPSAPAIPETGTLRGRVTGPAGAPVAGAHVWAVRCDYHEPELGLFDFAERAEETLRAQDHGVPPHKHFPATTDDDGCYEITDLSPRPSWQLLAFDRRVGATVSEVRRFDREQRTLTVDLRLVAGSRIRGRVMDEEGNPIGNAIVRLVSRADHEEPWDQACVAGVIGDDLGRFDAGFRCGQSIEVDCWAGGFLRTTPSIVRFETPIEEVVIDLRLRRAPGTIVRGRIVDPDGRPLDLLALLEKEFPEIPAARRPFQAGLCAIPAESWPQADESEIPPGGAEGRIDFVTGLYEVAVADDFRGVLELRIARAIVGTATLADPKQPVDVPCDARLIPPTGASATYPIRFVDAQTKLPIDLSRQVSPWGSDTAGISAVPMPGESDPEHGLVVYRCAPGLLKIEALLRGYACGLYLVDVPADPPAEPAIVELWPAQAVVRGTIRQADGAPASGVRVVLLRKEPGGTINAGDLATNPDGEFEFPSVAKGEHFVVTNHPGSAPAVVRLDVEPALAPLEIGLAAGVTTRFRVVPSPAPASARTRFYVLDPNGLLLDGVESTPEEGRPSASEFEFSLLPGRYVAQVVRTGFAPRDVAFDVPAGDEIVLSIDPLPSDEE